MSDMAMLLCAMVVFANGFVWGWVYRHHEITPAKIFSHPSSPKDDQR